MGHLRVNAMADEDFDRCTRCGALKSTHIVLQDAHKDDVTVLLCPRATFKAPQDVAVPTADDAELQKLMDVA